MRNRSIHHMPRQHAKAEWGPHIKNVLVTTALYVNPFLPVGAQRAPAGGGASYRSLRLPGKGTRNISKVQHEEGG